MNRVLIYILLLLIFNCSDKKNKKEPEKVRIEQNEIVISEPKPEQIEKSIFDVIYREIKDLEYFKNYEIGTSSVINYKESRWEYAFVEMINKEKRIIILEKIIETGRPKKNYQILDTIHINNFKANEFTSFGVCFNKENFDPRIFTIIEKTDNDFDLETFSNIIKAWKANLEVKKIEELYELNDISCTNEGYGI